MNRRSFLKRAAGMGAVVAGLAALPKGEAKAANATSGTWTGHVRGYVRNSPAPQIVEAGTHDQPWTLDFNVPGHAAVLDVDPFTLTDVSTSGPIQHVTLSNTRTQATTGHWRIDARYDPRTHPPTTTNLLRPAPSDWEFVEMRVDPRMASDGSGPLFVHVTETHKADGGITVEFRG